MDAMTTTSPKWLGWLLLMALSACAPQRNACADSGYNQNVCADEDRRRAAALAAYGMMQQQPAYQPVPYQVQQPFQLQTRSPTNCTSMPNGVGGFYTSCY